MGRGHVLGAEPVGEEEAGSAGAAAAAGAALPQRPHPVRAEQRHQALRHLLRRILQAPALRYAPLPAIPGSAAAQGAREHPHRGKMVGNHQRLPGLTSLTIALHLWFFIVTFCATLTRLCGASGCLRRGRGAAAHPQR
jgi:hypothetical protein